MKKKTKIIIILAVLIVISLSIVIGLLFAYKTELFVDKNRDTLELELKDREIAIPLEHKYSYTSPQLCIFESKVAISSMCQMFVDNIGENDNMIVKIVDEVWFLYLYTDNVFVQSIFIEPYGGKENNYRIGVNNFIPACLYEGSEDFEPLFQDPSKLVDGKLYKLAGNLYDNSFVMLYKYLRQIYDVEFLHSKAINVVVDNKEIVLKIE